MEFQEYTTISFANEGHDVLWWDDRIRFGDFNQDGITDILRHSERETLIEFMDGNTPVWRGDTGNINELYFTDIDFDGRTDRVRYNSVGHQLLWSSFEFDGTNGNWSAEQPLNHDVSGCGGIYAEFRFLNWDGCDINSMEPCQKDVFCLAPMSPGTGDWRVVLNDDPGTIQPLPARSDSIDSIVFGNFKTEGEGNINPNPELDDILYFGGSPIEFMF